MNLPVDAAWPHNLEVDVILMILDSFTQQPHIYGGCTVILAKLDEVHANGKNS
jgi:hypothetical protein